MTKKEFARAKAMGVEVEAAKALTKYIIDSEGISPPIAFRAAVAAFQYFAVINAEARDA